MWSQRWLYSGTRTRKGDAVEVLRGTEGLDIVHSVEQIPNTAIEGNAVREIWQQAE